MRRTWDKVTIPIPKKSNKLYDEISCRRDASRRLVPSSKITKKTSGYMNSERRARDFITRPELFSLLMWLPSLVVSRLSFLPFVSRPADILVGRFPTSRRRRAASVSDFFVATTILAKIYRSDVDGRMQESSLRVRKANGPASPFPQYARKNRGVSVSRARAKKRPFLGFPVYTYMYSPYTLLWSPCFPVPTDYYYILENWQRHGERFSCTRPRNIEVDHRKQKADGRNGNRQVCLIRG